VKDRPFQTSLGQIIIQRCSRFPQEYALELDIEIGLQTSDVAIRQVRESWVAEGIVLLEQHHQREVAVVSKNAGNLEAAIQGTSQRSRRAEGVEALEVHRPVGLELVDRVHWLGRCRSPSVALVTRSQYARRRQHIH